MLTIACVLKTGKFDNGKFKDIEYRPDHVLWLKKMVERYVTVPHRFVCLSNVDIPGCEVIPLVHNWPTWWSKIELFRPNLFDDKVFYQDLDTVIIKNIDDMVNYGGVGNFFVVLKNLSRGVGFGSGLMSWRGDYSQLYEIFKQNPDKYILDYSKHGSRWGDQGFLQERIVNAKYWQDLFPGTITSYYFDMKMKNKINPPERTKIVCFQGKPKPWEVKANWVPTH